MKKIVIISILFILILTGCSKTQEIITDGEKFKQEYESLNKQKNKNENKYRTLKIDSMNPFVYKTAGEILELIDNKESFVVYFGFASCPWCRSVISTLIEASTDLGIQEIYYVDVKEIRDTLVIDEQGYIFKEKEGTIDYYKLLEKLDNVLETYTLTDKEGNEISAEEKRIYAPNIISIIDGEEKEMTDGISPRQTDAYMDLTEDLKKESYNKVKCSIQCVADNKKVCSTKTKC